jgi:subtilisin-like proprotein convertase family protein
MRTRIALVVLAALLALPMAQSASPVGAKNRSRTITRTFSNTSDITVLTGNDSPLPASNRYPSPIAVDGLKGKIRDVNLRLNDLDHPIPSDVEVLLVGPGGQTAVVMAHVGGSLEAADVSLRLDDEAAAPLPNVGLQSGAFRPTNNLGTPLAFNAPAPPVTSANAALSVFDGSNPNGTWRLFVQDAYGPTNGGEFGDGWELEITAKANAKKKR